MGGWVGGGGGHVCGGPAHQQRGAAWRACLPLSLSAASAAPVPRPPRPPAPHSQRRHSREDPGRDARELVVVLRREGTGGRSEAIVDVELDKAGSSSKGRRWKRERGGAQHALVSGSAGSCSPSARREGWPLVLGFSVKQVRGGLCVCVCVCGGYSDGARLPRAASKQLPSVSKRGSSPPQLLPSPSSTRTAAPCRQW